MAIICRGGEGVKIGDGDTCDKRFIIQNCQHLKIILSWTCLYLWTNCSTPSQDSMQTRKSTGAWVSPIIGRIFRSVYM